jgi:hypothetical protein
VKVTPKTLLWAGGAILVLGILTTTRKAEAAIRRRLPWPQPQPPSGRYDWGEPPRQDRRSHTTVNRDPSKLLPSFAAKIDLLIRRMRAEGYDPMFWEGYRSPERAAALERIGSGIRNSIHIYGAAADIVDRKKLWSNPAFFAALGRNAKAIGLTWGGDWKRGDKPHVQGLPVSAQSQFRALPSAQAREQFLQRYA